MFTIILQSIPNNFIPIFIISFLLIHHVIFLIIIPKYSNSLFFCRGISKWYTSTFDYSLQESSLNQIHLNPSQRSTNNNIFTRAIAISDHQFPPSQAFFIHSCTNMSKHHMTVLHTLRNAIAIEIAKTIEHGWIASDFGRLWIEMPERMRDLTFLRRIA